MSSAHRGTFRSREFRRGLLLFMVIIALAAVPLVLGRRFVGCEDGPAPSLVVGIHSSLIDHGLLLSSQLNVPAAIESFHMRPLPHDEPGDLEAYACESGYAYGAWFGPGEGDSLVAVLWTTTPDRQRLGRSAVGGQVAGGKESALQQLAARTLLEIFGTHEGWPGLEYLNGASLDAVRNQVHGEAMFRGSNFRQAIPYFEYVVEEEPDFAYGWYRLANVHAWDRGHLTSWPAIARAVERTDSIRPADRDLIRAVNEHYQLEYGFEDAFTRVERKDAETLLQHGDAIFHLGVMHTLGPEAAVPHLEEALRLDPGLTPARLHLIDVAILAGDSVAAYRHYAEYSKGAGGSIPFLRAKYALELVFGTASTRRGALAAIDSTGERLPFSAPYMAQEYLSAPHLLDVQEKLLRLDERAVSTEAHEGDREVRGARRLLVYNYLYRGKFGDAARILETLGDGDPVFRRMIRYSVEMWGPPWAEADTRLPALSPPDPADPVDLFFAAADALDRRDPGAYDRLQDDIRELAAEDPDVELWRRALEARRRWIGGDSAAGRELERVVTHPDILNYYATHETMRWWLGEMAWTAGRWSESRRWFGSIPHNPWARCRAEWSARAAQGERADGAVDPCATADVARRSTEGAPTTMKEAQ